MVANDFISLSEPNSTTVKSPVTFTCTKTYPLSPYLSILTGVVDAQLNIHIHPLKHITGISRLA